MSEGENTVTMSSEEANALRSAHMLLNKLYNHPDKSMDFKHLLRETGHKVPELDVVDQVVKPRDEKLSSLESEMKKLREERDAERKAAKDKQDEDDLRGTLDSVRKEYGFDEEKMSKVMSRMKEKNNMDAEAAAAWVASKEPKPKLSTASHNFGPSSFDGKKAFAGEGEAADKEWKMLMDDAARGTSNHLNMVADEIFNQQQF